MATVMAGFLYLVVFFLTLDKGRSLFVEKGHPSYLMCDFENTVTSITWQLLNGTNTVNISNCSVSTKICTNVLPSLYQGSISSSGNETVFRLNVTEARIKETEFLCLADNGNKTNVRLDVYAKPRSPSCHQNITDTYVEYTCTTTNVYPNVSAVLHRKQEEFTNSDFNTSFTKCVRGDYGSGSYGDYSITCTWRVPIENMLVGNTIFVEMAAAFSDSSIISDSSVDSPHIVTNFSVPQVYYDERSCPLGDGVRVDAILIGTTAYCTCSLLDEGVPKGTAGWFTGDGIAVDDSPHPSLTLNLTYDYLDPNPLYECRPITPLKANVSSYWYEPKFTADYRVMEIGQPLDIECSFPDNITTVTWQDLPRYQYRNISTCNTRDGKCDGNNWDVYQTSISRSGGRTSSSLHIPSLTSSNYRQFSCLANNGQQSNITQLELYAFPTKPVCTQKVFATYVMYSCTSENVYPQVNVALHKRGVDFTENDYKINGIYYQNTGDGLQSAYASFAVDINNTILEMTVYAEFSLKTFTMSAVNITPLFSDDITTKLVVPVVVLSECPSGDGVHGTTIAVNTQATCTCQLVPRGLPPAYARWQTKYSIDGNQDYGQDGSSTVRLSYSPTEKNLTYECVAMGILQGNTTKAYYTPVFSSSAQSIAIAWKQFFIVIILAVCCIYLSGTNN